MAMFLLRRLGLMVLTLFILSLIVFFAGQIVPGDPGRATLGQFASPSAVQALDHQLGVDRPLLTRYLSWIGGVLHARNLSFGIYTSLGYTVCNPGGHATHPLGSYGHEVADAKTFAAWGVDYLKVRARAVRGLASGREARIRRRAQAQRLHR